MAEYEFLFRGKHVNEKAILGEPGTGFETRLVNGVDKGPFECHNCSFMKEGCDQKDMKAKSRRPRLPNGQVEVDRRDCCSYIQRIGDAKS